MTLTDDSNSLIARLEAATGADRVTQIVKPQEREFALLQALDEGSEDFGFFCFSVLQSQTGFDRRTVRLTVRRLARKGLAEFRKGLSNEDGEFYGAGYGITDAGRTTLAALRARQKLETV